YLLRHLGHVVSREMLTRDVWRIATRATPFDNVIDVTIARLRRKIDDPFDAKLLHTVRGVGFVLRQSIVNSRPLLRRWPRAGAPGPRRNLPSSDTAPPGPPQSRCHWTCQPQSYQRAIGVLLL